MAEPFSQHPVSDLIVVLSKDNKLYRRDSPRGIAVSAAAIHGVAARVHESLGESLRHVLEIAEVGVVAFAFARQQCVQ